MTSNPAAGSPGGTPGTAPPAADLRTVAEAARAAEAAGDAEAAVRHYAGLRVLSPDDPTGYVRAGTLLRRLRRADEAEEVLSEGVGRFPDHLELRLEHAYCAVQRQDHAAAQPRYQWLLERLPGQPAVYCGYGPVLRGLGRYQEAEALLERAVALFPQHLDIAIEHAKTAGAQGDWTEALRRWQALAERFPADPRVLAGRGDAEQQYQIQVIDRGRPDAPGEPAEAVVSRGSYIFVTGSAGVEPSARELMLRFETLATSCEFGLVQRHFGAEPLGLMRWNSISPAKLCELLEKRLEGVGLPENTVLDYSSGEYIVADKRYMRMHTFLSERDVPAEKVFGQLCRRMRFLADKLIADLTAGEKIFVCQTLGWDYATRNFADRHAPLTDEHIARLLRAVRSYGPGTLLLVREASGDAVPGEVRQAAPGLLFGSIDRLVKAGEPWNLISTGCWRTLCERAAELVDGAAAG